MTGNGAFERAVPGFAPGYMSGGYFMGLLLRSIGAGIDRLALRSFLGTCAAIPFAAGARSTVYGQPLQCELDVLPWHARDRGITLYTSEPEASKRRRLAHFRQLHARRGTHRGALEYVQPYFLGEDGTGVLPRMRIVSQDGDGEGAMWHTLTGSADPGGAGIYSITRTVPSNWDFDGQPEKWSRWWAILYTAGTILDSGITHWDDGSFWDGGQYWDGISGVVVADLVSMFLEWHSAHSELAGVILAHDINSFDPAVIAVATALDGSTSLPAGTWGRLVDPTTGNPTRLQTATWIYDRYYQ